MSERPEYHPMPSEPDRHETPAAKNKRLRPEREQQQEAGHGWQEVDLTEPKPDSSEEKKAA